MTKFLNEEEAEKAIQKLNNEKWPPYDEKRNCDEYSKEIMDIINGYFHSLDDLLVTWNKNSDLPFKYFRTRPYEDAIKENLICEYSYPPIDRVKLQRCNFPKHPVLYCSDDPISAIYEVIKNESNNIRKKFYISKWNILNPYGVRIAPYLIGVSSRNKYIEIAKMAEKKAMKYDTKLTSSQRKGMVIYYKYLTELFLSKHTSISAALVHRFLYNRAKRKTDIFLYPSIQYKSMTVNMAIHPNFVDQNMRLDRIYLIQVNDIWDDGSSLHTNISFLALAEVKNFSIEWRNNPNDDYFRKCRKEDFKEKI